MLHNESNPGVRERARQLVTQTRWAIQAARVAIINSRYAVEKSRETLRALQGLRRRQTS